MKNVLELMKLFPNSFINAASEVVLTRKNAVSFVVHSGMTRKEIISKIFEWCSRDCAKAMPYANEKRCSEWRDSLILRFNRYIGVNFMQHEYYLIYDRLGNAINHELTVKFIESDYDFSVLEEKA